MHLVDSPRSVNGIAELLPGLDHRRTLIAQDAVREIAARLADDPTRGAMSEDLWPPVMLVLGHFLDLLATPDPPPEDVLGLLSEIGAAEARAGRNLDLVQTVIATISQVAVRHLAEALDGRGPVAFAPVAQSVVALSGRVMTAIMEGHIDARTTGEAARHSQLLELLLNDTPPDSAALENAALDCLWPLPSKVAAMVLLPRGSGSRLPVVPTGVLWGRYRGESFLMVPDPDGPGRRRLMETALREWITLVGPTVPAPEFFRSLLWARRAAGLAGKGLLPEDGPVRVDEHLPLLMMLCERDLLDLLISRRLGPLMGLRANRRHDLATTLLAAFECGFRIADIARRCHVHVQTIRYRMRQLQEMFGDDLHLPGANLELHLAVRAWLLFTPPPAPAKTRR